MSLRVITEGKMKGGKEAPNNLKIGDRGGKINIKKEKTKKH